MKINKKITKKQKLISKYTEKFLFNICKNIKKDPFPICINFIDIDNGVSNAKSILYESGEIEICYDKKYVSKATILELDRTACHEICHCLMFKFMKNFKNKFTNVKNKEKFLHNAYWKRMMDNAGIDSGYYKERLMQ